MIKIAIVDDHNIFVDGVKSILEDVDGIHCIFTASNSEDLYKAIEIEVPDIILMDIGLGKESGIDITTEITLKYPNIKVLALSMHQEENYIIKMLEAGAKGYLLKDAGAEEMINAIRSIFKGNTHYSNHVGNTLLNYVTHNRKKESKTDEIKLTKREVEILRFICKEYSNPEIASELYISIRTVDTHRRNLLEKLNAKNTVGLVKYAIKNNLID
jgi:DNA-binding NarL/FixJ family response regulator